ncbi:O-antigen translocase [Ulvibacter litoralis]|nr:O-antigen translocase [Ulvibacter litoralis]GHC61347.1 LPS biosynthesis protein [Ulvibacter litoralis]
MTSLNAGVIFIRLAITVVIQRLISDQLGAAGHAKIGQLRDLLAMLMSLTTLGVFNGIVKYVSEYKEDQEELKKIFSTSFVFIVVASGVTALTLFFGASYFSEAVFGNLHFKYLFKILAVVVPAISLQRVFNGVINGLSAYKKFAKIELFGYLFSTGLLVFCMYNFQLDGILVAIAVTPIIQLCILLYVFGKVLKEYLKFKDITFKAPYAKQFLAFSLMSFASSILFNYINIDVRNMIENKITIDDSGYWTTMTNISKNYMVFSGSLFTLYVIPKFSGIYSKSDFKKEVFQIYKTLLPLFGIGMLFIYFFRNYIIEFVYPNFFGMEPLFKWQLCGDFFRLASLVLAHQFLAKKMVRSFIFSEFLSLALFYGLARYLTDFYGVEGVVMAHFIRYVIYFVVVFFLVMRYFRKNEKSIK